MTRPLMLNDQMADAIVNAIENGLPRHRAAAAVGISVGTLFRWLAQGETEAQWTEPDPTKLTKKVLLSIADDRGVHIPNRKTLKIDIANRINAHQSPYLKFRDRLRAGDARAMAYALQEARRTGEHDWRFWMTFLERRFPAEFGRRSADEETIDTTGGTEEEAAQMLERATEIRIKMLGTGS